MLSHLAGLEDEPNSRLVVGGETVRGPSTWPRSPRDRPKDEACEFGFEAASRAPARPVLVALFEQLEM